MVFLKKSIFLFSCIIVCTIAQAQSPRLLLTKAAVEEIRLKVTQYDWAKQAWQRIREEVDSLLHTNIIIPPRGSNWAHYYVSPEDGQRLKTGKKIGDWQWEHLSSVSGKAYKSDPANLKTDYDGVVIFKYHHKIANQIATLGLAYQISNDTTYALKAKELLQAYAQLYLKLPIRDKEGTTDINSWTGAGRVFVQSLGESLWTLQMAIGADFIWNILSESERKTLYDKLFRPATDVIIAHKMQVHNIQCWKNAAVGAVGFLYNKPHLIHHALQDSMSGHHRQVKEGLTQDGFWWEMAPSYHFYSFYPLWALNEMAANAGLTVDWNPIKGMLDGPLLLANAALELPSINDSKPTTLPTFGIYYDWGYAKFQEKHYIPVVKHYNRAAVNQIDGQFMELSLLYGKGELPEAPQPKAQSINLPESGLAIFAVGQGKDLLKATLKYHNPDGFHSHPDILGVTVYKGETLILIDPGIIEYGSHLQSGWYKTSVAHNTFIINEKNQKMQGVRGECLAFDAKQQYGVFRTTQGYENVIFTRIIILLNKDNILFFDYIETPENDTIDLVFHPAGAWNSRPKGSPITFDKVGYKYLENAQVSPPAQQFEFKTIQNNQNITLKTSHLHPIQCITAKGIGEGGVPVPAIIFRKEGKIQATATLLQLNDFNSKIDMKILAEEKFLLTVKNQGINKNIGINLNGQPFANKNIKLSRNYVNFLN